MTDEELDYLKSRLYRGFGLSVHRVRCLPELFPSHNSCNKDR